MRYATATWFLSSLMLLTGCDPIYGISRRARIGFMPEPARVGEAIETTPGVEKVLYRFAEGGRPLTITGIHGPEQVHTFIYDGGTNVHGVLQFVVDYKHRVEYSQTLVRMGAPPPQDWLDATHPVMILIEGRLADTFGLTNLQASVVELCLGVKYK